jgi:hypothetical protein
MSLIPVRMRDQVNGDLEDELFFFRDDVEIHPTYSVNTRLDDMKIRRHYIEFAKHRGWIPTDFVDEHAASYFKEVQSTLAPPSITADGSLDEHNTVQTNNSSASNIPQGVIATSTSTAVVADTSTVNPSDTSSSASDAALATSPSLVVTKIRVIQETVTIITMDPVTKEVSHTTTTISRPDLMQATQQTMTSALITKPLFTYGHIFAYISSKIEVSKANFDEEGEHSLCKTSINTRFLASCKRMMNHELDVLSIAAMDESKWAQISKALNEQANAAHLPIRTKIYFPVTRAMLSYWSLTFPQGSTWFPLFMLYCCLYQLGVRNTSLASLKWSEITYHRVFTYRNDTDELREASLQISYIKKKMIKCHYPLFIVGYNNIPSDHEKYLLSSPDVLFWLNLILLEKEGIGLQELLHERHEGPQGTARYQRLTQTYIFTFNSHDDTMNALTESQSTIRKRANSISILCNMRMKEVAEYCGMSSRILDMITVHHSLRQGAVVESEAAMRKSNYSSLNRNAQFGWTNTSSVPVSVYDISNVSQNYQYANTRFSILSSGLPQHRDEEVFVSRDGSFTRHNLIELIQSSNGVEDCKFRDFKDNKSFYCEQNMDMVRMIWSVLQPEESAETKARATTNISSIGVAESATTSSLMAVTVTGNLQGTQKIRSPKSDMSSYALKKAIVFAVRELYKSTSCILKYGENMVDEYNEARKIFLMHMNYMRRDEMGIFILKSLQPYSDASKGWGELVKILDERLKLQHFLPNDRMALLNDPTVDHIDGKDNPASLVEDVGQGSKPYYSSLSFDIDKNDSNIEELKQPSDTEVKNKMKEIASASLVQLNAWLKEMDDSATLKSIESVESNCKPFSLYVILSYLLYKSENMTESLHRRALRMKYHHILAAFWNRLTKEEEVEYDLAIKNRTKGKPICPKAVDEISHCLSTTPYIRRIYGWGKLIIYICPAARKDGLVPQQLKDWKGRSFKKNVKGAGSNTVYHTHQAPMEGILMESSSPPTRGRAYASMQLANPVTPERIIQDGKEDSTPVRKPTLKDTEGIHGNRVQTSTPQEKECEEKTTISSQAIPRKRRLSPSDTVTIACTNRAHVLRSSSKKCIHQNIAEIDVIDMTNIDDDEEED